MVVVVDADGLGAAEAPEWLLQLDAEFQPGPEAACPICAAPEARLFSPSDGDPFAFRHVAEPLAAGLTRCGLRVGPCEKPSAIWSVAPLMSRRASGDAGHVPGCARDHALDTACGTRPLPADADPHEAGLRRVQAARAALRENLRAAFALDEGQVATVLRMTDALAAGVSLEARETLGREVFQAWWGRDLPANAEPDWELYKEDWMRAGDRLFAIGRASVTPPDPELARVIAAWTGARAAIAKALGAGDYVAVSVDVDGAWHVTACAVRGEPATADQWAKLRAAGVPVADGVGV